MQIHHILLFLISFETSRAINHKSTQKQCPIIAHSHKQVSQHRNLHTINSHILPTQINQTIFQHLPIHENIRLRIQIVWEYLFTQMLLVGFSHLISELVFDRSTVFSIRRYQIAFNIDYLYERREMAHDTLEGVNLYGRLAYEQYFIMVDEHLGEKMGVLEMDFRGNLFKFLIQFFCGVEMLNHKQQYLQQMREISNTHFYYKIDQARTKMSYMLPHLDNGWEVDQAILNETDKLVVIRFGHDWNPKCMQMDQVICRVAYKLSKFVVFYVVDLTKVPDFNVMYELYDEMTLMFFYRNRHMMIDTGTGNNNKITWVLQDQQELIDICEVIYKGARKGKGLVISPVDYGKKLKY